MVDLYRKERRRKRLQNKQRDKQYGNDRNARSGNSDGANSTYSNSGKYSKPAK